MGARQRGGATNGGCKQASAAAASRRRRRREAWLARTSLSRFCHSSLSRGPALTVSSGIFCTVALVVLSHESAMAADCPALL